MANDINSVSNSTLIRPSKGETKPADQNKTAIGTPQKGSYDVLEMSESAVQLQRIQNIVKDLPDVRLDKVSELKQSIQNGTYEVNAHNIADKLIALQSEEK